MGRWNENSLPPSGLVASELEGLFREHAEGLLGAVRGILGPTADPQELLQEAFLRAWKALEGGKEPPNPVAWVFVLTLNLARDQRRRSIRRGPSVDLDEVNEVALTASEPEPAQQLARQEALDATRDAIYELEEGEKEVFLLRVSGELSFDAIAEALKIPVGTAKTRMRSAIRSLRRQLKAFAPDPGLSIELQGDA